MDTVNAAVGTSFNITFTVFDSHRLSSYTPIVRTITVASQSSSSQFYCAGVLDIIWSPIPCYLLSPVLPDVSRGAPDIYLDIHNVPMGSVELLHPSLDSLAVVGGLVKPSAIRIWGVCGWALPVNLLKVCGARSADSCAENAAQCALRVTKVNAAAAVVSVSSDDQSSSGCTLDQLQQEFNSNYDLNKTTLLSDRKCLGCSAQLAMQGQCEPSRYSLKMHGIDALSGEQGATMATEIVVTPAIADAHMHALVAITAASDEDLQVLLYSCML